MLTDAEKQIIIDTLLPFEPTYIGIFGSVARGEDTPESDVDILTDVPVMKDLFELGGVYTDLKEGLGRNVDVVLERGLSNWLLEDLLRDLKIIHGKKDLKTLKGH